MIGVKSAGAMSVDNRLALTLTSLELPIRPRFRPVLHEEPIRNARLHRRRDAQRLVNPNKVVPDRVERDHVTMVLEFL